MNCTIFSLDILQCVNKMIKKYDAGLTGSKLNLNKQKNKNYDEKPKKKNLKNKE